MPTPLDLVLDPVSLVVFSIYGALVAWEALFPARPLPAVAGWKTRGLLAFAVSFFLSSYLPLIWAGPLARLQIFDLASLGTYGGAFVGLLAYQAGVYAWHRAMHASDRLWLGVHQMHHSAERLDTFGAFYASPLDMIGWTVLASVCLTVLGVTVEAATLVMYANTFLAIFQHTNVRTPRWLGYVVQRPESHAHHHARGVHGKNYSDLAIFDLVLGTLANPREYAAEQGFWHGASARVLDMLRFRDVSQAPRSLARARSSKVA